MSLQVFIYLTLWTLGYALRHGQMVATTRTRSLSTMQMSLPVEVESIQQAAASLQATSALLAEDSGVNPFFYPLLISAFTMVPFLYYQQALRPKPRTVQQIELDENLRPVDKKGSGGKVGDARAKK